MPPDPTTPSRVSCTFAHPRHLPDEARSNALRLHLAKLGPGFPLLFDLAADAIAQAEADRAGLNVCLACPPGLALNGDSAPTIRGVLDGLDLADFIRRPNLREVDRWLGAGSLIG